MKAIVFGLLLSALSIAAVAKGPITHFGGPPAPLCDPTDPVCNSGGN